MIKSSVSSLCKSDSAASLVSVVADHVSYDDVFIQGDLASFLRGKANHVDLLDDNYDGKKFSFQGIGGNVL